MVLNCLIYTSCFQISSKQQSFCPWRSTEKSSLDHDYNAEITIRSNIDTSMTHLILLKNGRPRVSTKCPHGFRQNTQNRPMAFDKIHLSLKICTRVHSFLATQFCRKHVVESWKRFCRIVLSSILSKHVVERFWHFVENPKPPIINTYTPKFQ